MVEAQNQVSTSSRFWDTGDFFGDAVTPTQAAVRGIKKLNVWDDCATKGFLYFSNKRVSQK